jgi:hypothetical protein
MNNHPDFKTGFDHPDPDKKNEEQPDPDNKSGPKIKKKVDFCTYWTVSQCGFVHEKEAFTNRMITLGIMGFRR